MVSALAEHMPFSRVGWKHRLWEGYLELFADGKVCDVCVWNDADGVDGGLTPVPVCEGARTLAGKHLFPVGKSEREELHVCVRLDSLAVAVEDSNPRREGIMSCVDAGESTFACVGSVGLSTCVAESKASENASLESRVKEWSLWPSFARALDLAHDWCLAGSVRDLLCCAFVGDIEQVVVEAGLEEASSACFFNESDRSLCNTVGVVCVWRAGGEFDVVIDAVLGDRLGDKFVVGPNVAKLNWRVRDECLEHVETGFLILAWRGERPANPGCFVCQDKGLIVAEESGRWEGPRSVDLETLAW